jgi:hypothetical protein
MDCISGFQFGIMTMYAGDGGRRGGGIYHRTLAAGPFFDSVKPLFLRGALDGEAFWGEPSTSMSESESLSAFDETVGVGPRGCSCGVGASAWFFVPESCSPRCFFHSSDIEYMRAASSSR